MGDGFNRLGTNGRRPIIRILLFEKLQVVVNQRRGRVLFGLSQEAIAEELGKAPSMTDGEMISRSECSKREPSLLVLLAYEQLSDCQANWS
jgi:transcriptional regulator with XRE-family HTH domain